MSRNPLNTMDSTFSGLNHQNTLQKHSNVNRLKSQLTLDFHENQNSRRTKCSFSSPTVLSSPDVKSFALSTPEIAEFLSESTKTPTPGCLFPKDLYPGQFENAYVVESNQYPIEGDAHKSNSELNLSSASDSSDGYMKSLPVVEVDMLPQNIKVKDEPQTVPSLSSSPGLSPINMECQDVMKLERKRYRNRLAASKCRKRKLERIATLEGKVNVLKSENHDLSTRLKKMKAEVCHLKERVMKHCRNGCNILPHNI